MRGCVSDCFSKASQHLQMEPGCHQRHSNLYTILSVSVSKLAGFSCRCWNSATLFRSEMLFPIFLGVFVWVSQALLVFVEAKRLFDLVSSHFHDQLPARSNHSTRAHQQRACRSCGTSVRPHSHPSFATQYNAGDRRSNQSSDTDDRKAHAHPGPNKTSIGR